MNLLDLASELGNVSKACRIVGYSRQQFHEIRRNYQTYGADGLIDRLPGARTPNRVPEAVETAVLEHVLADQPRWVFHFTPTSASWLNAVEGFFSIITRRKIRRGVFKSVADLEVAIRGYIRDHHRQAKPFVWTKTAGTILEKRSRLPTYKMWVIDDRCGSSPFGRS